MVLLTSSCSFLDIDTPGIVNNGKMFGNEQGFIDEIAQLYFNDYGEGETTLTKSIDLKYRDSDVRARTQLGGQTGSASSDCMLRTCIWTCGATSTPPDLPSRC